MRKASALLVAAVAVGAIGCAEKLESTSGCPLLCPQESVALRDTTLDAIVFDTTVSGIPPIGSEDYLLLASHGDSLDTRAIVRYDTLLQTFSKGGVDSTVTRVDSAYIRVIQLVDSTHRPTAAITFQLYDVDTTAADTVAAALVRLFRPDRLIGSTTFAVDSIKDTLNLSISNAVVLDRITRGTHLRVGIRLVSSQPVDLRLQSTLTGAGPTLTYRVTPDTSVTRLNVSPLSRTPPDLPFVSTPLADYVIVAAGTTATPATILGVGGLPVRRSFLRFNLPTDIIDSSTVVRATLLLTQRPTPRGVRRADTVTVYPVAIVASPLVTDVFTAMQFLTAPGTLGLTPTRTTPADSGVKPIEIVALVKAWRTVSATLSPRVLALQSAGENSTFGEIDFFSTRAPAAVRPRLRITYVPRAAYGVP